MKFLLLLCLNFSFLYNEDYSRIRADYKFMHASEEANEKFVSNIAKVPSLKPTVKNAYLAVAEMASAQYKFSPVSKFSIFNSGKKKLEKAVSEDINSLEIRYIRLSVQKHVPFFLGYNKNIVSDKTFIIQNLKSLKSKDQELFVIISAFLIKNFHLTELELQAIKI